MVVADQGRWGDEDAEAGSDPADGGQLPGGQRESGQVDQGVGAALPGGAQVTLGGWAHQRLQGGAQRGGAFGVEPAA